MRFYYSFNNNRQKKKSKLEEKQNICPPIEAILQIYIVFLFLLPCVVEWDPWETGAGEVMPAHAGDRQQSEKRDIQPTGQIHAEKLFLVLFFIREIATMKVNSRHDYFEGGSFFALK